MPWPGIDSNAFVSCALIKINQIIVVLHILAVVRDEKIYLFFDFFLSRLLLLLFLFRLHGDRDIAV